MEAEEELARQELEQANAIAASRGVRLRSRVVRARARGEAIVVEAEAASADLIVLRAPPRPGKVLFGKTVDYVLKHARCRVLVMRP
jgi:nucleotide-binding universal stress UspA family protein